MSRLTLVTFGPPEVLLDDRAAPPELTWRKHLGLIVYLARSPSGVRRRDHLVGLLWPDKEESRARHSLNEACRAIRRAIGEEALESRGEMVALDLGSVRTDTAEAEEALAHADATRLLAVWRGEFLEGFGIPDASAFEDWVATERMAWRQRFRDALTAEAERLVRGGHHPEGLAMAARVLRSDRTAEGALRVAMLADTLAGAAPAALARFDEYRARLADETGAEPAADLVALVERIRGGTRMSRRSASGEAAPLPPLVGRDRELGMISEILAGGGPRQARVVVASGGPGLGKSRIVREVAERARLEGAEVFGVTCVASDIDAPGSVLSAALRRGLTGARGLASAAPEALGVLADLEPEIARRYPGVTPVHADGAADLGRAFGETLAAVAEEQPVVVALDDAHLADDLSLDALPALLRAAQSSPVTLLLSTPAASDAPPALTVLRSRIGHDIAGVEVALGPLADADVERLVTALLPAYGEQERARLVRRLRKEAAGVPLFVVEIVRALAAGGRPAAELWPLAGQTTGQPLPFPVPGAVRAALTLRASALHAATRDVLLAAAVAGSRVDPALVADMLEAAAPAVEAQFYELERRGFLRDEGAAYHFTAEIVRLFLAAEMLTGGQRRRLHQRAASALAGHGETAHSLVFAEHLFAAGEWKAAFNAALGAAEAAAARGAGAVAARARDLARRAERHTEAEGA